ncbi:MAG TPA: hypothetical protein EYN67_13610 [Flavobacteriales bacterium]|nr:hypothetical protein [Flavobacteriales bacterium]
MTTSNITAIPTELLAQAAELAKYLLDNDYSREGIKLMIDTCKTLDDVWELSFAIHGQETITIAHDNGVSCFFYWGSQVLESPTIEEYVRLEMIAANKVVKVTNHMPVNSLEGAIDIRTDKTKSLISYLHND